ncbi:hypothetical protein GCM10009582_14510 [Arthrobacter flavus]
MCGLAGAIIGACAALLFVKNWTPDWIEATGTWFGGVGTILTLLWAVRAFRADQAAREEARESERTKDQEKQSARDQAEMKQAESVLIELRGGAANGSPPNRVMVSFHLEIKNLSQHDVAVLAVTLDKRLKPKNPPPANIHISSGEIHRQLIEVADVPALDEDLGGREMSRFTAEMNYRLEGLDWQRGLTGSPQRLHETDVFVRTE